MNLNKDRHATQIELSEKNAVVSKLINIYHM